MLLAGQTWLRYGGFLQSESWFALHVAIGWAWLLALLRLANGPRLWLAFTVRARWVLGGTLSAICAFWYLGRIDRFEQWWSPQLPAHGWLRPVWGFAYFSLAAALFRLGVPLLLAKKLGMQARDLGWRRGAGGQRTWPAYLGLYLAVLPAVVWASGTMAFQAKYPLARALIGSDRAIAAADFLAYQALYVLVFVSGECFWRGFAVFGLHRDWGRAAILWMLVPYAMSHFGKPMAEALGAILAGTVLGLLALRHRSVWLGVALHYGVAVTMDVLAMARGGIGLR